MLPLLVLLPPDTMTALPTEATLVEMMTTLPVAPTTIVEMRRDELGLLPPIVEATERSLNLGSVLDPPALAEAGLLKGRGIKGRYSACLIQTKLFPLLFSVASK